MASAHDTFAAHFQPTERISMKRIALIVLLVAAPLVARDTTAGRGRGGRGGGRAQQLTPITDTLRAHALFVSKDPKELPGCGGDAGGCAAQVATKHRADSAYEARAKGLMEFHKVTYKSRVDGLEIPAYLFAPLTKRPEKHAALVWVHGGVHGDWGISMFPFIKEVVQRGYVVITPDSR